MLDVEHDITDVVDVVDTGRGVKAGELEFGTIGAAVWIAIDAVWEKDAGDLGEGGLIADDTDGGIETEAHTDVGGLARAD